MTTWEQLWQVARISAQLLEQIRDEHPGEPLRHPRLQELDQWLGGLVKDARFPKR